MGLYRISELAERTGFSASALRFYEQAGLLAASERTPAGYRLYDQDAVERLAFIARAKQFGLPLEEIKDLLVAWDMGRCAPVQERLRPLLKRKIDQVEERIAELTAFAAQLRRARAQLVDQTPDGPCDESCGCLSADDRSERRLPLIPLTSVSSCSLPATS